MTELPTGTMTFLFTDIEGGGGGAQRGAGPRAFWPRSGQRRGPAPGTRLWEQHPEAMQAVLARHDGLLRAAIVSNAEGHPQARGPAPTARLRRPPPLRVRTALHTGAAPVRQEDYFGPALNRVARLLAAGHGRQVLLSEATACQVREALPGKTQLRSLGVHRLRYLSEAETNYQ
jgi:class 3 adenylate cyclase